MLTMGAYSYYVLGFRGLLRYFCFLPVFCPGSDVQTHVRSCTFCIAAFGFFAPEILGKQTLQESG